MQSYVFYLLVMSNRLRSLRLRKVTFGIFRQYHIVGHVRHHVQYLGHLGYDLHIGN